MMARAQQGLDPPPLLSRRKACQFGVMLLCYYAFGIGMYTRVVERMSLTDAVYFITVTDDAVFFCAITSLAQQCS